jgi:hypothetical protein
MVGEQENISDKVVITYVSPVAWLLHGESEEDKGESCLG